MTSSNNFQLKTLRLAGHELNYREITNADQLFDNLIALGPEHEDVKDERIPYWADLWPSAVALATHILRGKELNGIDVLEIGCGLGLPGIAAGMMGAQVTFSDYMQEALGTAKENWKLNHNTWATFIRVDWRNPPPGLQAKFILASDVAYEQKSFQPLVNFIQQVLAPNGTLLLSEPGRKYTGPLFEAFETNGFRKQSFSYPVTLRGITTQASVFEISR